MNVCVLYNVSSVYGFVYLTDQYESMIPSSSSPSHDPLINLINHWSVKARGSQMDRQTVTNSALGSIHTRDLLGVNYCVNFSLNNGLYVLYIVGIFTLSTFAWTEKFSNGVCTIFQNDMD